MSDGLDLNLLRVFDALMETGSVSGAAVRLHLSVPATSRALGRLRRALGDPILVRAGRGLVPTPFALRSVAQVRSLLEGAEELLSDTRSSEPRTWRRSFALRINDGLAPVLASRLISSVAAVAPGVSIRFVAQDSKDHDVLRDGTIDLDVGVGGTPAPDIEVHELFVDRFVALVCADSTMGRAPRLTVDDLVRYPHISASRRGKTRGPLDDALEQAGRARRVVAVVPTLAAASLLALEPDLIALVPYVLARHLQTRGVPVRSHDLPFALPAVTVNQRWHRRFREDRPSQWLRSQVAAALDEVRP